MAFKKGLFDAQRLESHIELHSVLYLIPEPDFSCFRVPCRESPGLIFVACLRGHHSCCGPLSIRGKSSLFDKSLISEGLGVGETPDKKRCACHFYAVYRRIALAKKYRFGLS